MTANRKATRMILAAAAALAVPAAAWCAPAVDFEITGHPEFMKTLPAEKAPAMTAEEKKKALEAVFNEKAEQHSKTKHFEKGLTCVTCHDQQKVSGPDWMIKVTNPPMKKECGDCHTTQAEVRAHADTHSRIDCVACHMPNVEPGSHDGEKGVFEAVRRLHAYKIDTSADGSTYRNDEKGAWKLAGNDDGHIYADIVWSCGRATRSDYTLCDEGQGCHSSSTSKLDKGLVYQNQAEMAGEVAKWQKPMKEAFKKAKGEVKRMRKLLEVTKLAPAEQTEARLLLDKASDIVDYVEKDGSYGAHASNYIKDRVATAEAFLARAQKILDDGEYGKPAGK